MDYTEVKSLTDIKSFLLNPVWNIYFLQEGDAENPYNRIYVPVEPLRIRFLRTTQKDCGENVFQVSNPVCYNSEYNSDTANTFNTALQHYYTASENDISTTVISKQIHGEFSSYDGSGFTWDFLSTVSDTYQSIFTTSSLYSDDLRAVIINMNHYSPNYDYWLTTQIVIENSVYGSLYAHAIYPKVFRSNLATSDYQYIIAIAFLRIFFSLYFMFYYFYYAFKKTKYSTRNLMYLLSYRGLYDISMFILFIVVLALVFNIKCDDKKILKDQVYFDFNEIADIFENILIINAWSSIFIIIRFLNCLTINKYLNTMKLNIDKAGKNMAIYLFMVLPILFSFIFMAWTVWGRIM